MPAAASKASKAVPDIDAALAALADPNRRRAIELLGQAPRRAGELADLLGLPPAATSKHLKQLRAAGLVEESHPDYDARVRIYALRSAALAPLRDWLAATEAMWTEQLAAFKSHLEDGNRDA